MKSASVACSAAALLLLAGCSMHQSITINTDGSGSAQVRVVLGPLLVHYMDELLASLGPQPPAGGPALFDLAKIRSAFGALPGVRLTSLSTPRRDTLALDLAFTDINRVLPGGPGGSEPPLELTDHGGVKTLRLVLSRATLPAVEALPPFQNDPLLLSLGPQQNRSYTKEQYLSLLEYAFADIASKEKIRAAMSQSAVDVTVTVNGTIVSQSGGSRTGNRVTYHVPLIDIVTLEKPVELSVSFR